MSPDPNSDKKETAEGGKQLKGKIDSGLDHHSLMLLGCKTLA